MKFKNLLKEKNIFYHEINYDDYLIENKEQFLSFIREKVKTEYKTFPMIFFNSEFIGGFNEGKDYYEIKKHNLSILTIIRSFINIYFYIIIYINAIRYKSKCS